MAFLLITGSKIFNPEISVLMNAPTICDGPILLDTKKVYRSIKNCGIINFFGVFTKLLYILKQSTVLFLMQVKLDTKRFATTKSS